MTLKSICQNCGTPQTKSLIADPVI